MKTYKQVLDQLNEVDFVLAHLRVDLEDLEQSLNSGKAQQADAFKVAEAANMLRVSNLIESLRAKILLARYETEYKRDHDHKYVAGVLE